LQELCIPLHFGPSLANTLSKQQNVGDKFANEHHLGSLPMYLLFAPTALSLLSILAVSLHSEFAAKANL
jgi:hypothetical protein